MFAIIGIVIVFGAVIGGYLLEHGNLMVLVQPAELVIIGGAAIGTLLIANSPAQLVEILKGLMGVLKGSRFNKACYLENLKMLSDIFNHARKNGLVQLEGDVEDPKSSALFSNYPKFLADHHALAFLCDTLRTQISGGVDPYALDMMMETDMEVHHHEAAKPIHALMTVSDALPGLGIVAAVLGVVITMGALGGPPEEIGHRVAAALVGTFLGILLCYGLMSPLAANMSAISEAEGQYYQCLRTGLASYAKGLPPILAVEFARRVIPAHVRPTFKEMEDTCRGK